MSENIIIDHTDVLSKTAYTLKNVSYRRTNRKGEWQSESKEVYDRGNAVAALLYNPESKKVLLTRQFRLPTFLNGHASGMLIEACAGMLEDETPEIGIRREAEEETGCVPKNFVAVFDLFMSAGSLTERMYFFTASYSDQDRISEGGGLDDEKEDITVLEIPFDDALKMIANGQIRDAKTVILLQHAQIHNLLQQ